MQRITKTTSLPRHYTEVENYNEADNILSTFFENLSVFYFLCICNNIICELNMMIPEVYASALLIFNGTDNMWKGCHFWSPKQYNTPHNMLKSEDNSEWSEMIVAT